MDSRSARDSSNDEQGRSANTSMEGRSRGRALVWVGNLLATAAIVLVGLAFGREIIDWWRGDGANQLGAYSSGQQLPGVLEPSQPLLLSFGDLPQIFERFVVRGSEEEALAQLRVHCRRMTLAAASKPIAPFPLNAGLLKFLQAQEAVEQGPGWRIVQQAGPILTVVALRSTVEESSIRAAGAGRFDESVVSWGLGLRVPPAADVNAKSAQLWTLYICADELRMADTIPLVSVPLPAGTRRTLVVRTRTGGALISFAGASSITSSKLFFDELFEQRGAVTVTNWQRWGTTWHARYKEISSGTCDVQLMQDDENTICGMVTVTSTAESAEQ